MRLASTSGALQEILREDVIRRRRNYLPLTTASCVIRRHHAGRNHNVGSIALKSRANHGARPFDERPSSGNVFPYSPGSGVSPGAGGEDRPVSPDFVDAVNNNALPRYAMVHPASRQRPAARRHTRAWRHDNWRGPTSVRISRARPSFATTISSSSLKRGTLLDHSAARRRRPCCDSRGAEMRLHGHCGGHPVFLVTARS